MMHSLIKIYYVVQELYELQIYARTDRLTNRENSAHLRMVELFFSLCSSSRRIQFTFITIKTQKNKQTNKPKKY